MARIVVIEDNPTNLELMTYLLSAYGHAPEGYRDGQTGLEAVLRNPPDLVLCDIQLPILSGYDVAHRARAQERLKAVALVAVTALAMRGDREKVLASGFDGYIEKPIQPSRFVGEVEAFLKPAQRTPPPRLNPDERLAANPNPVPEGSTALRPTVLVVDDVQAHLDLAQTVLEHGGYRVLTAQRSSAAQDILRRENVHLVLSDVHMPGGGGFDLCRAVRASGQHPDLSFVFLSSSQVNDAERKVAAELGVCRLLERPVEPSVLLAAIEFCLPATAPRPARSALSRS